MSEIEKLEFVFLLLLLFVVVFGLVARKAGTPYPIMMVAGGLLLGSVPRMPSITLDPDLIFLVVLPPILYSSAWTTSWRDFRYNFISIFLLAFGLVGFTVLGVALVAPIVMAGFDWRLGLVLGAVVAPTDAIAATAIARRVGLPGRIVDILEGESLLNDATGLLALQFATAIVVSRQVPTISAGLLTLAWLVAGGVGLGLAAGWVVKLVEERIDDGPIEIALSILVPYAVYLAADAAKASGVLAVVACGLYLGRRSTEFFSPAVRLQVSAFWESFTFMLNGLVFVLIGLQLPVILASIREFAVDRLILDGLAFSALLILLRLAWIFPATGLSYFLRTRLAHQAGRAPGWRQVFVLGWTGMRGVISLAAALALPAVLADGSPFPYRDLIVFLSFCVIVVTLVLQGITLPPLIRALGLAGKGGQGSEEQGARLLVLESGIGYLEGAKHRDGAGFGGIYDDLIRHRRHRLTGVKPDGGSAQAVADHERFVEVSRDVLLVERETAVGLRNDGHISDQVLRRIQRELDLTESRLSLADGSTERVGEASR